MAVECASRALRFSVRVYMQHDPRNLTPIGLGKICVKQAQIRDDVLFVVCRQRRIGGCLIGDIWIKRRFLHWLSNI